VRLKEAIAVSQRGAQGQIPQHAAIKT